MIIMLNLMQTDNYQIATFKGFSRKKNMKQFWAMKKQLWVILLSFVFHTIIVAQTDTLFWFAVPYSTTLHDAPLTADLTLTATDLNKKTIVTITQPYNPLIAPIVVTIDPAISLTKNISFTQADLLKFSNNQYNTKSNSALLIRADHEITAYYETHRLRNNPAIFSLKGKNALGYDFWTPFQNQWPNHVFSSTDPAFSQIIIVATEDNTTVTVNLLKDAFGHVAGTPFNISLNKGQTYMIVPKASGTVPSVLAADRLVGTHITSNKPIAVTLGDDSVQKSGAYDYMGDQSIPVKNAQNKSVIGFEYIVMKGKISDLGGGNNEKAYVLTTQANTFITVTRRNGTFITYGPYAAGFQLAIDMLTANNDYYVHILATKPVYVLHIAGFGDELGDAILPTIDGCTGSLTVSFTRSKNQAFYLNLMTKADAIDSFYISINGGPAVHFLSGSLFEQAGTSDWFVLKDANKLMNNLIIPTGAVTRIFNTKNVFHLGFFNGVNSGGGCVYGYFSDYNELEASATVEDQGSVFQVCGIDSIELKAKGGTSYHWSPTEYLDNPNVQNPILRPPYGGFSQVFTVDIEQPCNGTIKMQVWVIIPQSPSGFIAVDYDKGCAPTHINMNDASHGATGYILDLGDGTPLMMSSTPINLSHIYANNSNTLKDYILSYTVNNDDGCNDFYTDTIRIFPQVTSDFELTDWNDTTVCHSAVIGFRSRSSGNTDAYQWNFGDGSSRTDTLVSHTYTNYSRNDTVYHVNLIATSPYGCKDTSDIVDIRVFPYIYSSFTVDSTRLCSPAEMFINPKVSVGVDTFYWSLSDKYKIILDSSLIRLDETPILFNHNNTTRPVPDTIQIAMHAVNRFGCADTATTRSVIIYPKVQSGFSVDKNSICDSVGVVLSNNSSGFNLVYEWDFGNGTSLSDTASVPFTRYYFNKTDHDTVYTIRLVVTSDYFCKDTATVPLAVYPFIKANFAVDYSNNCSPLLVQLVNTSKGGTQFNWNYGDGTLATTFVPDIRYHLYENNTDKDTTFFIKMRARNLHGCSDSIQRTVSLFPRVVADFNFDSPNQGCNPLNVTITNISKGKNLDYTWDFGDKTYSTNQNPPAKSYKNTTNRDTTYFVTLTAMNLAGCDSSLTRQVQVYSKVTADFAIARLDSCSPFKIAVSNFSSGGITDFVWRYSSVDSLVLHSFSDPDIPVFRNQSMLPVKYPIVLKTRNIHGCTASKRDTIMVFPEIHVDFHPDFVAGCQPLPVNFKNNTNITGGTSFFWDFNDGLYSNLASPGEHEFSNLTPSSRLHHVHLEATSQFGCFDDTTVTIEVYPYIFAKFTIDKPAICSGEPFTIDRTSSVGGISHYYWKYNNAGASDGERSDPQFSYTYLNKHTAAENHEIRLTVTNTQGCDTSWTEDITTYPEVRAAFEINDSAVCFPAVSSFINHSQPAIPLTYYWDLGDGSSSANKNPVHAFKNFSRTADQQFTIGLTATSEFGCDSSVSHLLTVHPKPLADFNYPLAVDCPPFVVPFTDNSQGINLGYLWNFDNGVTSTLVNPVQTFTNGGSAILEKTISLIITTPYSCSDTATKPVSVYPGVNADFTASAWSGCNPLEVQFDGTATNENEYYWYIDGEVFSNYEDPNYRFVNESSGNNTFNVKFRAVSQNGCTDDTTKQVILYPKPVAEFLPEPQVQEFNTATDITVVTMRNLTGNESQWQYHWEFGDGTTSSSANANVDKPYTIWGDIANENRIPVRLTASNANNPVCADTIMHYVIINPPKPLVDLGPDVSGCMPLTLDFPSVTKYNYSSSYQWDFGYDGQTSTDENPASLTYNTAGVYIIRLSVHGDGGSNWDYRKVTVYPKPLVSFSFTPDYAWIRSQSEDGTPIKFFNTTQEGNSYLWDFGDGETSHEFQPMHEYMSIGSFYITLIASSDEGCMDTLTDEKPLVIEGRGGIKFPNAITITPDDPAEEYYDPAEPDPRIFRPVAEGIEKYRLEIYNRWGELIFVSEDVNKGWNGFIKGSPAKQDVYVWRVRATFTNGRPYVKAGDVTLLVKQP
jgi:PKD repeat protein